MRKLLLLLVTAAAAAQSQTAAPPAGSGFTGSNTCKTCHADVWMNFYKNPHYKSIASGKQPEEKTGCEGCHGPARKHVEARGGKTTIPRAFSLMQPKQVLETCLGCHARDLGRAQIGRGPKSANRNTRRTTWRAPVATPSTIRPRRNPCWRRSRPNSATAATPRCAHSSPCLPSTV